MSSPVTVTTAPTVVATFNRNRVSIFFQNTGANAVYVKKQIPGAAASNPSSTNYDFVLPAYGTESDVVEIPTMAGFIAATVAATSTLAVMEVNRAQVV